VNNLLARLRVSPLPATQSRCQRLFRALGALSILPACLLMLLLASPSAHAQVGSNYGWYAGFTEPGTACWAVTGGGGAVRCASPGDDCESLAIFYAFGGPVPDAILVPYMEPQYVRGEWTPGIACTTSTATGGVSALYVILPPGVAGDSNSPPGYSPPNDVQPLKQVGGGTCGCSADDNADDNTQNGDAGAATAAAAAAGAESDAAGAAAAAGGAAMASAGVGNPFAGDPINVATGNMYYHTTDYTTPGPNPLGFKRYFNSRGVLGLAGPLGAGWHSSYDRFILTWSSTQVAAQRADGQMIVFNLVGSVWTPDSDVDYTLTNSGSTWTLHDPDDAIETYTAKTTGYGVSYIAQLNSIQSRSGYTKTLAYNSAGQLSTVTDSYSRVLTFSYNSNGTIHTLITPDFTTITYGYSSSGLPVLTSVSFPTSPVQAITYVYGNSSLPYTLTGVTDENGNAYLSWTYDAYGRALTSTVGTGSNATVTTVAYNDTTGSRTVTNALGVTDTYNFSTLQNAQKVTSISRAATSTTAAATESFAYDSNGYLNSFTDWNGNQTTYVNNSHGLPTTINEAVGSTVARTTTITYDTTFVRLPATITTPGVTTTYAYDTSGNVHTKTLTDTTTASVPYSTNGQARTWTYGYTNFFLTSVQSPRTDVTATTTFVYAGGTFSSFIDALGHVTHVSMAQTGGYPQKVVDPNSVTRGYSWDARQRLVYDVLYTSAGNYTTYYNRDPDLPPISVHLRIRQLS